MLRMAEHMKLSFHALVYLSCVFQCFFCKFTLAEQDIDPAVTKLLSLEEKNFFTAVEEKHDARNEFFLPTVGKKFHCNITSEGTRKKATSVHKLTPYDVDVVAAMGDSLSAARAGRSADLLSIFLQFRGMSFSIGGDGELEDTATLPNILKKFNPKLKGFSHDIGDQESRTSHLNVAVSGAKSADMLSQAKALTKKLKEDKTIDFKNDWKLLTILIGANDLCDVCESAEFKPEKYVENIREALDYLHQQVPRMFINMIAGLDLLALNQFTSLKCKLVHNFVCKCLMQNEQEVALAQKEYIRLIQELIETKRYDTRDDFTVVHQRFLEHVEFPETDKFHFLLAPDCFHFSVVSHACSAQALWRNMLEPVGKKSTSVNFNQDFIDCPRNPWQYFYTEINSKWSTSKGTLSESREQSGKVAHGVMVVFVLYGMFGLCTLITLIFGVVAYVKHRRNKKGKMLERLYDPYHEFMET